MKLLLRAAALLAVLAGCGVANAGGAQGLVSGVFVHTPGIVMFQVGSAINNKPSCATTNQWAISLTDAMGKPILAVLLAAQAQGKQVVAYGYTNTCRDWGDRELPSYLVIVD